MPSEQLKQIELSRTVLQASENETMPYEVLVSGERFVVLPGVFSPKYFNSTELFSSNFPNVAGHALLEIGCGTGITSVLALKRGAVRVVGVDINPIAIQNAKLNATRHGFPDADFRLGDVFSPIRPDESFDLIYWNAPFIYLSENRCVRSVLELSLFDPGYEHIARFLSESSRYLSHDGLLVIGWADFGDQEELNKLASVANIKLGCVFRAAGVEGGPVEFQLFVGSRVRPSS